MDTHTVVVGHPGKLSFLEILRIVESAFIGAAPLIVQTFTSSKVIVGVDSAAVGIETIQGIVQAVQAAHDAAPAPAVPFAQTVRGVVR